MTKIIEQFKMKKLAKKIAGVTLGAVALGAMSMTPVYATEEPRPGYLHGVSEKSGEYVGTGAVTISDASDGTLLATDMKIYGIKDTTIGGTITGSVKAANFDSSSNPGVTGLQIWGGWSNVDGVKGIDNKVIWSDTAKVNNIKTITGFEAYADGASATGTDVTVNGATVAENDGKVYGAHVISPSGNATATGTTLTLNNITTEGNNEIWGAKVEGTTSAKADKTEVKMTGGSVIGDFYGVGVDNTDKAEATRTTLTINGAILTDKARGAFVKSSKDAMADTTKVTMTGGELHNSFNAAEVQANEAGSSGVANNTTLKIDNTRLTISDSDGITGAHVTANAGGEILSAKNTTVKLLNLISTDNVGKELTGVHISGDTGYGKPLASATADTTKVKMNGGKVKDVVGAKFYHTKSAEAKVTTVKLNNVEEAETVIGVNVTEGGDPTPIAETAKAKDTTVTVTGTKKVTGAIRGVNVAAVTSGNTEAQKVTATNTKLTINGTTVGTNVGGDVTGVWAKATEEITATNTQVIFKDSASTTVTGTVYGVQVSGDTGHDVQAKSTKADTTMVKMNGGKVKDVVGAMFYHTKLAEAKDTTVTLNNVEEAETVIGVNITQNEGSPTAIAETATANNTKLTIKGTNVGGDVAGVRAKATDTITAKNTRVIFKGDASTVTGTVYGVQVSGGTGHDDQAASTTADTTKVKMNGGKVKDVVGAMFYHTKLAEAKDTTVTLNNVEEAKTVIGVNITQNENTTTPIAETAKAYDTTVTVTGTTVTGAIRGVNVATLISGDEAKTVTADNTKLTIKGTTVEGDVTGVRAKATDTITATDTQVIFKGDASTVTGTVYGVQVSGDTGHTEQAASTKADKTKVKMNGGNVQNVVGAMFYHTKLAEAKDTTVKLNKVEEAGTVIGVNITQNEGTTTPIAETATAYDTTVKVTGTTVNGAIRGVNVATLSSGVEAKTVTADNTKLTINGTTVGGDVTGVRAKATDTITATNTQVIFEGEASEVTGTVYGVDLSGTTSITSSGTALTLKNTGNTADNIAGFDTINFVLPSNIQDDEAILTLTTTSGVTDLTNTDLTIDATRADLNDKDKVLLIDKKGTGALNLKEGTEGAKATTLVENATTVKTGTYALVNTNDLVLKISEDGEKPQDVIDNEKSLTETIAASVALLNSGADFATEQALGQAKAAAREGVKEGTREMMTFAAFGGSSMRYKSGSHIDAKGWNAAVGFAKEQGELTYGIAVEHGQANFDSYVNAAHGEGKNKYTGGVIFAELKKKSGVHFDASFRAGRAENDYNANLSVLGISTPTSYDISATYLGFSLGGGKEMKMSETGTIDLYGRYYFNHLNGANAKTNSGIDIDFKDSDSSRLRLGTRYTQKVDEYNKLYAGLAWQYEFAGKAKAVVNGTDAPSPSLKGHSAMLELGIKSKAGKNLDIDLGLNGWVGKQRGIGGNIGFKWSF